MENVIQFIENDLGAGILLKNIKAINEVKFNKYIQAFKEFQEIDFDSFIEQENLNKFKLAKYIIDSPPTILNFIIGFDREDYNLQKYVADIFKLYYLYTFGEYEANSFKQYLFTKNIAGGLVLTGEFYPELYVNKVFSSINEFAIKQHHTLRNSIKFENKNREYTSLELFIKSLTPEFRNQFSELKFIPHLIKYLYDNGYIDKYGSWNEKTGRKTEIFGLLDALKELHILREVKPVTKGSFCKAFRLNISYNYFGSKQATSVSNYAKSVFLVELGEVYRTKMPAKLKTAVI